MRLISCAVLLSAVLTPLAKGQAGYLDPNYIPRVNVALGYNLVRGNAPPAVSNTFGANGQCMLPTLIFRAVVRTVRLPPVSRTPWGAG